MILFTAEAQRAQREILFSFPLRSRKAKTLSSAGHVDNYWLIGRIIQRFFIFSEADRYFSFAVLSTANEKYNYSASSAP